MQYLAQSKIKVPTISRTRFGHIKKLSYNALTSLHYYWQSFLSIKSKANLICDCGHVGLHSSVTFKLLEMFYQYSKIIAFVSLQARGPSCDCAVICVHFLLLIAWHLISSLLWSIVLPPPPHWHLISSLLWRHGALQCGRVKKEGMWKRWE